MTAMDMWVRFKSANALLERMQRSITNVNPLLSFNWARIHCLLPYYFRRHHCLVRHFHLHLYWLKQKLDSLTTIYIWLFVSNMLGMDTCTVFLHPSAILFCSQYNIVRSIGRGCLSFHFRFVLIKIARSQPHSDLEYLRELNSILCINVYNSERCTFANYLLHCSKHSKELSEVGHPSYVDL